MGFLYMNLCPTIHEYMKHLDTGAETRSQIFSLSIYKSLTSKDLYQSISSTYSLVSRYLDDLDKSSSSYTTQKIRYIDETPQCLDDLERLQMSTRERGPFDDDFEAGYVPMDSPPGFEEREYAAWKAAGGVVTRPDLQRARTDTRNLEELLAWLEYGRVSGYRAARCSEAQEHHWADLLRELLRK